MRDRIPTDGPVPVRHRPHKQRWSFPVNDRVRIVNDPPFREIYVGEFRLAQFAWDDVAHERFALIALLDTGVISPESLAVAYGVGVTTLAHWRRAYREKGLTGLQPGYRGHTRPVKATEQLAALLQAVWEEAPQATLDEINDRVQAQVGYRVSAWVLAKLEREGKVRRPRPVQMTLVPNPLQNEQPGPDPNSGPAAEPEPEPCPEEPPRTPSPALEPEAVAVVPEPVALPGVSGPSRYAGVLLYVPLLQRLLEPVFAYVQERQGEFHGPEKAWGIRELLLCLLLYLLVGVQNPEASKRLQHVEFGRLFARRRGPSAKTLRRSLPMLTAGGLPDAMPGLLARQYARLGYVRLGVLYLDGHFVPYYGDRKVPKGFFPQRRMRFRGHYQYWACDVRGRPVFLHLEQGFVAFPDVIRQMVRDALTVMREVGESGPLVVVFDRGGHSKALFRELDDLGVGWITWKRHRPSYPEEVFTETVSLPRLHGKPDTNQAYVTTARLPGYDHDLRCVVLRDPDTGEQAAFLTNLERLYPGKYAVQDLTTLLHQRWRLENCFKEGKLRDNLDHAFGYDIAAVGPDDCPVPNPAYRSQQRRLWQIERQVQRYERKRSAIVKRYETLKRKPSLEQYLAKKGNRKWLAKLEASQRALQQAREQLQTVPAFVPYKQLHDRDVEVVRLHRLYVLNTLQGAAYNLRHEMLDRLTPFFPDHRERSKVLDALVHAGGRYECTPAGDRVILQAPSTPAYRRAAQALLASLNEIGALSLDGSRPLRFELETA